VKKFFCFAEEKGKIFYKLRFFVILVPKIFQKIYYKKPLNFSGSLPKKFSAKQNFS
jgi:hypothetical protein